MANKIQLLSNNLEQIAWAIFLPPQPDSDFYELCKFYGTDKFDDDEYIFHSAHWSKKRAKEMLVKEWIKPKIVKIKFTIQPQGTQK